MPERKSQDEIESIILEFLAGQTEPVSKQSIIIKVYGPVYDDSLGRTVTQALTDLEGAKPPKVHHPKFGYWLPA